MLKHKAHASHLEWQVEDMMRACGIPVHIDLRDPRWDEMSDIFWACMAYGNYDLAIAEDEEEDEYP